MARMRMNQAVAAALADEMRDDPDVVVFGEDVAAAGGPFKTSDGLLEEFGPSRVRDTPISEMGFLGMAVGAAASGLRPVAEIMFIEFLGVALDQLVTEAAKFHFLSKGVFTCPLTVRASIGAGLGFGCQHSQTLENWMSNAPGLKMVMVSDPQSAYGLLRSAVRDPNPVVVLEPRALYGGRGQVTTGTDGIIPLGEARRVREGTDVTVVSAGAMVKVALAAAEASDDWSAEVIDLQTLIPWDREGIISAARRDRSAGNSGGKSLHLGMGDRDRRLRGRPPVRGIARSGAADHLSRCSGALRAGTGTALSAQLRVRKRSDRSTVDHRSYA